MKQSLLIIAVCFIANPNYGQQLSQNRWKETERTTIKGKNISYTDTFYIQRPNDDEILLRKGAFMYKGKVEKHKIEMGYTSYSILKNTKDVLTIKDDQYIHTFTKDYLDQSAKDAAQKKAEIDLPPKPVPDIDHELLSGKWLAYKRTGRDGPLAAVDYKVLIKTLTFDTPQDEGYHGFITTDYIGGNAIYSIKNSRNQYLIVDDENQEEHKITVWRLTPDELVIEDENKIIYYMKRFN